MNNKPQKPNTNKKTLILIFRLQQFF